MARLPILFLLRSWCIMSPQQRSGKWACCQLWICINCGQILFPSANTDFLLLVRECYGKAVIYWTLLPTFFAYSQGIFRAHISTLWAHNCSCDISVGFSQQVERILEKSDRLRADMFGELLQAANTMGDLRNCPVSKPLSCSSSLFFFEDIFCGFLSLF